MQKKLLEEHKNAYFVLVGSDRLPRFILSIYNMSDTDDSALSSITEYHYNDITKEWSHAFDVRTCQWHKIRKEYYTYQRFNIINESDKWFLYNKKPNVFRNELFENEKTFSKAEYLLGTLSLMEIKNDIFTM